MGELVTYDDWLQAQNCLLGAALLEPKFVPRIVTELSVDDFSGNGRLIFKAMADLFRQSRSGEDVDAVAISHYLGNSSETRTLIAQYMGLSPVFSEIDRYIAMAREAAKVSRLRSLGDRLAVASSYEDAVSTADAITAQLVERPGLKGYEPAQLLDAFYERHKTTHERIANHLGTAREVVTRMLRYFQTEGMVTLTRGAIEIIAPKQLEDLCAE